MKVNFKLILIFGVLFSFINLGLWTLPQFMYVNINIKKILGGMSLLFIGLMILNMPLKESEENKILYMLTGYLAVSVAIIDIFISIIGFIKIL